ncbi:MAG: cytochrome c biogenesis protein ResB [Deferrisomatales bacterium]
MSTAKTKQPKGLGRRVKDFFCSIKLSIFVLIALAATSIFGTVIQQGQSHSVYVREYGEGIARVIGVLDLGDMYHSWWFQLLLALLLVNITFCSIRRLPHALRLMRDRDPVFDGRPVAIHERWEQAVRGVPAEEVARRVEGVLARKVGAPVRAEQDGKVYLFATRGGWSRMGVYVTHFSLFLFAVGALVGGWFGFKGFVQIPEGESVSQVMLRPAGVRDLGFTVRCDDFEVEFYADPMGRPTGRPKDYRSRLTVLEGDREVLTRTIEVNHPLIYKGIYFYQSSYGQAGGRGAWLTVFGPRRNLIAHRKHVDRGGRIEVGEGVHVVLRNLAGDFRGMGPAAEIVLEREGNSPTESTVVFENPQGNSRKLGDYIVRLDAVESVMYTGLQVAKDPGVPVIWAGCILITLGCLAAFFASHRRIWARVSPEGKSVRVFVGGNASRNRISFERWFGELCEETGEVLGK